LPSIEGQADGGLVDLLFRRDEPFSGGAATAADEPLNAIATHPLQRKILLEPDLPDRRRRRSAGADMRFPA
jgi:hypothetical protein